MQQQYASEIWDVLRNMLSRRMCFFSSRVLAVALADTPRNACGNILNATTFSTLHCFPFHYLGAHMDSSPRASDLRGLYLDD
jgi:hypothetical protein